MKPGLMPDRPLQGEADPTSRDAGIGAGVLVPVVPPCWTSRGRGSRAPGARRARGKRAEGLALALPPPIRFRLQEAEETPPKPQGTRPGGPIPPR
jgi:hypothetical protein